MRITARALLVAMVLAATVAAGAPAADGKAKRAATPRLKAFASCAGLIGYARRHVPPPRPVVGPRFPPQQVPVSGGGEDGSGTVPPAAPAPVTAPDSAGNDSSTTNIQEAGVDEPDIAKSDGTNVYTLTDGVLRATDARSPTPRVLSSVRIPGSGGEFLLQGRRILAISSGGAGTVLTEVDVANPAGMRVVRTLSVDGEHISSRLTNRTVRIVVASVPRAIEAVPLPGPISTGPQVVADAARKKPLRARRAGWVPSSVLRNRRTHRTRRRALVACDDVRRTPRFSGAGMVTVLTVDLERGLPAIDSDAVMTDARTVYASLGSVYVATAGGWERGDTSIHRFDINGPQRTDYRASGQVPGELLNQFSLSEDKGVLRAATTGSSGSDSQSYVTVLATRAGRLEKVGQVGGLGRGERIYAVRFIGDRGYVVTFRQTDPLFTLDLADPSHPTVRGELKLLGFSSYLHPVGEHELLGIGQDATPEGIQQGTQLSLFDVADPAAPRLLQRRALGVSTSSEAEYDHHAFLWWAPKRLAVVPVSDYESGRPTQAMGFSVNRDAGIGATGTTIETSDVLRTVVVAGRLFTLTGQGLHAYDLDTFASGPLTPFPPG
ncbi:MAG: beta-propeller domain-containing protein [Solirubrobacteraceae bacterium]